MQDVSELPSFVSAIVYSKDDHTVLISTDQATNDLWLPSVKVVDKNNESWNEALTTLLRELQKLISIEEHQKVVKVLKVWQPKPLLPIFHVVYKIIIKLEIKKKLAKRSYLVWMAPDELLNQTNYLKSTEMIYFINHAIGRPLHFMSRPSSLISFPEVPWDNMKESDIVLEIEERDIIVDTENPSENAPSEQLISSAGFTKKDQSILYKEFLLHTFPALFLNKKGFEKFLGQFNWITENSSNLFRTADLHERQALSFKDFLHIMAVYEGNAAGFAAEVRSRYIFRYFVNKIDEKMDYIEFRKLIEALLKVKGLPCDGPSVSVESDKVIRSIGLEPGSKITLSAFLKGVGSLKIRGTSSLLRFPKSVVQALKDKHATVVQKRQQSVATAAPRYTATSADYEAFFQPVTPYDMTLHAVRIKKSDVLTTEIKTFWSLDAAVTSSSTKIIPDVRLMKSEVTDVFSKSYLPNDILRALEYFKCEVLESEKKKKKEALSWGKVDPSGFGNALLKLCEKVIEIFKEEPRLLEVASPVYVLGDLHGNYMDLVNIEKMLFGMGPMITPCNILLLGDYVDRGPHGIEVIAHLLSYKLLAPQQIWMIRGNHEVREVQKRFTFVKECKTKFGEQLGNKLWQTLNAVFDVLPLAAIIDDQLFCCHGGIPPPWLCVVVESINSIPCPLRKPDENHLAWELMWNDPVRTADLNEELNIEFSANEGFANNFRRGTAHLFNTYALEKFLLVNAFTKVIRAHEVQDCGFQIQHKGKLITVFSASHYCGRDNEGAVALCYNQEIRFFRLDSFTLRTGLPT